jgi:hypothetical protein
MITRFASCGAAVQTSRRRPGAARRRSGPATAGPRVNGGRGEPPSHQAARTTVAGLVHRERTESAVCHLVAPLE